jgi:hypothetical protein
MGGFPGFDLRRNENASVYRRKRGAGGAEIPCGDCGVGLGRETHTGKSLGGGGGRLTGGGLEVADIRVKI